MRHFYLTLLGLLFPLLLGAQTLSLINDFSNICQTKESTVRFNSSATFPADNKFSIQIQGYYYSNFEKTVPATASGNQLVFNVGELGFPDYVMREPMRLRIISTKPALQSDWSNSFSLSSTANLLLTAGSDSPINPNDPFYLQFQLPSGSFPISVTLSDSSQFTFTNYYYNHTTPFQQALYPKKTATYRVAKVSNACGIGTATGSASVTVNPFGIRTGSLSSPIACAGDEIRVAYSVQGGTVNPDNKFKIRLTRLEYNEVESSVEKYDLEAVEENGVLKAVLPTNLSVSTPGNSIQYSVRVVTSSPVVVGNSAGQRLEVRPAPAAYFSSGSQTIKFGSEASLQVTMQGMEPFQAVLSDGTRLENAFYYYGYNEARVRPARTTTYSIRSFQSGCSKPVANPQTSVVISVLPGIVVDSIPTGGTCENQRLRFKISHNLNLAPGNQFYVRLRFGDLWTSPLIPAQLQGDYLEIIAPVVPVPDGYSRYNSVAFQISSSAPSFETDWQYGLTIKTLPTFAWSAYNTYAIDKPQTKVSWYWTGKGGGPYEIETDEGKKYTASIFSDDYVSMNVPGYETKTFNIVAIRNACGTTPNPASATLTVRQSADRFIIIKPYKSVVCRGDSLELEFMTKGDFEAGNLFRLEVRGGSSCCNFPFVWAIATSSGKLKFKLPTNAGWYSTGSTEYSFRIASTNPVVFSDEYPLEMQQPPYSISYLGDQKEVRLLGPGTQKNGLSYYGGTPMTVNYSIAGKEYIVTSTGWYGTELSYPVSENSTFTLKTLSNACGAVTVDRTIKYTIQPYFIKLVRKTNSYDLPSFCTGSALLLNYIMQGTPDPAATLAVQMRRAKDATFNTVMTSKAGTPIVYMLPDSLLADDYVFRLVSDKDITSDEMTIRVRKKATARLTTPSGAGEITSNSGYQTALRLELTGSPEWNVLYSDNLWERYSHSPADRHISPVRKTNYSLQELTNSCGYGTVSGQVQVSVEPIVQFAGFVSSVCKNSITPISYASSGDFNSGNLFKIGFGESNSRKITWIDSTAQEKGTFKLTLPSSLTAGIYNIYLSSTNPVKTNAITVSVIQPLSVALSGNATINPDQTTAIRLVSLQPTTSGTSFARYVLSDGSTGDFITTSYLNTQLIDVRPKQTTTYRITQITNECGTGTATGTAVVTVNPPSDKQVNTGYIGLPDGSRAFCSNDTLRVPFQTRGTFSGSNRFTVQLSDSTGTQFTTLTTFGNASPLKALIPPGLPRGTAYRVQVIASDGGTASATNPAPLEVRNAAGVAFDSPVAIFEPGRTAKIKINFTGDGPWTATIGNEFQATNSIYAATSPLTFEVAPMAGMMTYRLYGVRNVCGVGKVGNPSTVQISMLTATEPSGLAGFRVYPNPTSHFVQVENLAANDTFNVQVTNLTGQLVGEKQYQGRTGQYDVSGLPAGVYLFHIHQNGKTVRYRLVKN